MFAIIEPATGKGLTSLFNEQPLNIDNWRHGSTRPITVALVDRIEAPQSARLWEPRDLTGWSMRAALGKGFLLPQAGAWWIRSGISLTAGTVSTTKRYEIMNFVAGDDFTNIGAASNATGIVFTASGTTPTTWTNGSSVQEITANIVYNPSAAQLQAALDGTAWEVAAGGITVTGEDGFFYYTFSTAGARATMSGNTANLAPLSVADFQALIDGTTTLSEVQIMRLVQNPGAFKSLGIRNDAAGAGVIAVQVGGGGLNAKYRVSLTTRTSGAIITGGVYRIEKFVAGDDFVNVGGTNVTGNVFAATGTAPTTWTNKSAVSRVDAPPPYDGKFSISIAGVESALLDFNSEDGDVQTALEGLQLTSGVVVTGRKYKIITFVAGDVFTNIGAGSNATGVVFVASGTTPTTWTNGSTLSPVGAGNISVTREAQGSYLLGLQGDMANTDMGVVTADGSALRVISTMSGVLDLRTSAIDLILGGETSVAISFEIEGTPPADTVQKLFRSDTETLNDSIIDPSNTQPSNTIDYALKTVAAKYRIKDDGTFQLWNADQNLFHTLTVSGAAGFEVLNISAGEA